MGTNETYSKDKAFHTFGSKIRKRKRFELISKAQKLAAEITNACAKADKNYRLTICQDTRHNACDLVHMMRYANARELGDVRRVKAQMKAAEQIENLYDMIPILRICRCITLGTEGEIEKSLLYVKSSFEGWLKSDLNRMKTNKEKNFEKAVKQLEFIINDYFPEEHSNGK